MTSFRNDYGNISHHKTSLKGKVQDYIISFENEQLDIREIISDTSVIFQKLYQHFIDKGNVLLCRLIAQVNYVSMNDDKEETLTKIHFPSYMSEYIINQEEFFERHMLKIASRMDTFQQKGSNLRLKNIAHIHVELNIL